MILDDIDATTILKRCVDELKEVGESSVILNGNTLLSYKTKMVCILMITVPSN